MAHVTLTSDFGTSDGYVGAIKGVILRHAPDAHIVDITHNIAPFDLAAAAFVLSQAAPWFPDGTIHVAVVDPGVGGARKAVVIDDGRHFFVGPDNGLFALVAPSPRASYEIAAPQFKKAEPAPTFHGRDVFAVAAGRLAAGARAREVGPLVELEGRLPRARSMGSQAVVVHVDRFGNLITDLAAKSIPAGATFHIGGEVIEKRSRTFADVQPGELVAYIGSAATLEIAIRQGNAAAELGVARGATISLELPSRRGAARGRGEKKGE